MAAIPEEARRYLVRRSSRDSGRLASLLLAVYLLIGAPGCHAGKLAARTVSLPGAKLLSRKGTPHKGAFLHTPNFDWSKLEGTSARTLREADRPNGPAVRVMRPPGNGANAGSSPTRKTGKANQGGVAMVYHWGAVMVSPITVYPIFVQQSRDTWTTTEINTISAFLTSLGTLAMAGTPRSVARWWNITRQYGASGIIKVHKPLIRRLPSGTSMDDPSATVLKAVFSNGLLPVDPYGIYTLMVGSGFKLPGHCTAWCGYHTFSKYSSGRSSTKITYAVMGDAQKCSSCRAGASGAIVGDSVNGQVLDGIISVLAHELAEAASDPYLDAWYADNNNQDENADICAWDFGTIMYQNRKAYTNIGWNNTKFFLQTNYMPLRGPCVNFT